MRLSNGKLTTTDGPFIESKEIIGGQAILQPESKFMDMHRQEGGKLRASLSGSRLALRKGRSSSTIDLASLLALIPAAR
jgi:hypothetical protein